MPAADHADEAAAQATGADANQRADHAVQLLLAKAHHAGITLNEDRFAAARAEFVEHFTDCGA